MLLIDANIGKETLDYVLSRSEFTEHVIYEPISTEKSERVLVKDNLSKLTCFKPNMLQLQHLVKKIGGEQIELSSNFETDKRIIKLMVARIANHATDTAASASRLKTIILTLGENGVLIYDCEEVKFSHMGAEAVAPESIVSVVGAGDCFMAGYIAGLTRGKSVELSVSFGQACARETLKSVRNVADSISSAIFD